MADDQSMSLQEREQLDRHRTLDDGLGFLMASVDNWHSDMANMTQLDRINAGLMSNLSDWEGQQMQADAVRELQKTMGALEGMSKQMMTTQHEQAFQPLHASESAPQAKGSAGAARFVPETQTVDQMMAALGDLEKSISSATAGLDATGQTEQKDRTAEERAMMDELDALQNSMQADLARLDQMAASYPKK
eukprot:TRINITY_DN4713_c0_g1_i1.p1 TRINITY_DN4713_c0_g1~~TRINITY_DN4713_c0_g1_i1.p1  ORF type:complete len:206 (+),score=57.38 TRINITY_DN4713_c0_g1_i1:48-620(+)